MASPIFDTRRKYLSSATHISHSPTPPTWPTLCGSPLLDSSREPMSLLSSRQLRAHIRAESCKCALKVQLTAVMNNCLLTSLPAADAASTQQPAALRTGQHQALCQCSLYLGQSLQTAFQAREVSGHLRRWERVQRMLNERDSKTPNPT